MSGTTKMTKESGDRSVTLAKRQRIAKTMARAGLCSRRDAEAWVTAGRVSVNGEVLTSPARDVGADDVILVDGAPLRAAERTRLFLFHKPRGLVTSDRDPEGRATVFDYLRESWPDGPRVVSVGRLDINTEGLLLLTNDGGLARVLELPQTGWARRYRVRAKGVADPAALDALAAGITIDGVDYAGIEAKLDRVQGANCWLTVGLREGKNREVKRVLEHLGLEVNRLIRVSFGPFQLLDLPDGAVEEVRARVLRDQLGPSLAAQAGVSFETSEAEKPNDAAKSGKPAPGKALRDMALRDKTPRDARERGGKPGGASRRQHIDEPAPRRERPVRGTRKHVSSLRAAERAAVLDGPRRRVERSDTQDRRARTVTVERLVSARPAQADPQKSRRPLSQSEEETGGWAKRVARAPRQSRDGKPSRDRHEGAPNRARAARPERAQRRESPSAEGKRQRVQRSGAARVDPSARDARSDERTQRRRTPNKGKPHGKPMQPRGGRAAPSPRAKSNRKPHGPSGPKR